MLKQQAKTLTLIAKLLDTVTLVVSFALAYRVWSRYSPLEEFLDYFWIMAVAIPLWHYLVFRNGLYASIRMLSLRRIVFLLGKVHLIGGVFLASCIYILQPTGYSRGLFLLFLGFSLASLCAERVALKLFLVTMRRRGYNSRNVVIAGSARKALELASMLEEHAEWGLRITGLVQVAKKYPLDSVREHPVLGRIEDLVDICKAHNVDEVVFCLPHSSLVAVDDHVREMESIGVTVRMVLDIFDVHSARRELSFFHDAIPILTFHSKAFDGTQLLLKRCLDIAGGLTGLLFTALLFPFIAAAVRLDSPGPVLFGQKRVGENGRTFTCWKFRSMYLDAEERKKELMERNEMSGAIFKIRNDPRITRVGAFLRKTSLDELPQFWSVLRGEMSLVGTRPPTPDEVAAYENWHRRRICIKPGVTGLWQVSGRNQITQFDDVVRLDLRYIDSWSLWLDVKILLKTFKVVFVREGSC